MDAKTNTASMETADNKTKRFKRANKENIECLSEGTAPLKKIKAVSAVGAEMVTSELLNINETVLQLHVFQLSFRNRPPPAHCFRTKLTRSTK